MNSPDRGVEGRRALKIPALERRPDFLERLERVRAQDASQQRATSHLLTELIQANLRVQHSAETRPDHRHFRYYCLTRRTNDVTVEHAELLHDVDHTAHT